MNELANRTCEACRADAPKLTEDELSALQPNIPEWSVVGEDEIPQLKRAFKFGNFVDAMQFANKVGDLAEAENHHPAITVEWGKVTVLWWTHKIRGLHHNDVIMAAKTDVLA